MLLPSSTVIFLLLFPLAAVHGDSYGGYCPSSVCGNITVSYPFYEITESFSAAPAYCGYPGFGLSCIHRELYLDLPSDTYIVKSITYSSKTVFLVDADVVYSPQRECPRARHNLTIDTYPFTNPSLNLTFYFNCTFENESVSKSVRSIECLHERDGRRSYVFVTGTEPREVDWVRVCEDKVVTAVMEERIDVNDLVGEFGYAMRQGFELDWGMKGDCGKCEASGGRCGYQKNQKSETLATAAEGMLCYCQDGGINTVKCKSGRALHFFKRPTFVIVVSTLGSVALLTGICSIIIFKRRKVKLGGKGLHILLSSDGHDITSFESLQFDFETIRAATDNFKSDNKLGQGGFGSVYKGTLIDGKEIAVKRLAYHSGQGDHEFTNEVVILAILQHRNLVRLLGYCLEGNERLLIYEFVPNSSLDHFLFDDLKRVHLDWETRYKIISGIAKGLLYLHEDSGLRIIHRDLKAGNILLDEEMCPKIADFGMARLFILNQTQGDTSRIVGTYGYMAPEYAMHGKFSVKSDVYSFGVLLLEIISGQKNSRFCIDDIPRGLPSFAWENWKSGKAQNIIDPSILNGHINDILRCIHIGLLCVQDSISARPTMATVALMLSSASQYLPLPSEPAYFSSIEPEMTIRETERGDVGTFTVNQVSFSDKLPR